MEDAMVLVHEKKISSMNDLIPLLEQTAGANKPLLILTEDLLVEEVEPVSHQMTCIRRFRSCWTAVLTNYLPSSEPTANRNPDDWVLSCISICYDFMMKKWPGWSG